MGSDLFISGACFLLSTFGHEWFSFLSILDNTIFYSFFPLQVYLLVFYLPVLYIKAIQELFLATQIFTS